VAAGASGFGGAAPADGACIIIVPLNRAAFARGSNSLPHDRHLLAWSVTDFPQCGQNAMDIEAPPRRARAVPPLDALRASGTIAH
jgi:hypothetical protein